MIFNNSHSIFLDRLSVDCLLSDNKFVKIFNFFVINNYTITKKYIESVDIVVLDLCGVQQKFIDFAEEKISDYINKGKKIVLIGCISKVTKDKYGDKIVYIDNTSYKDIELYFDHKISISDVDTYKNDKKINQLYTGNHYTNGGSEYLYDLLRSIYFLDNLKDNNKEIIKDLLKKIHIIEISTGCQFKCTYCNIKKIKGNTKSLPLPDVLEEIKREIKKGKTDIFLLSDDCGSYGIDVGSNFGELVKSILELDSNLKIYITNIHPAYLIKYYDTIKEFIYLDKIPYILSPMQHSSKRILDLMNRKYNIEKLVQVLSDIKENSNTKLNNQIIFNYYKETLNEFILTYKYLKYYHKTAYYKYSDVNNIFGNDFISFDFEKKIEFMNKIKKLHDIDLNIFIDTSYK